MNEALSMPHPDTSGYFSMTADDYESRQFSPEEKKEIQKELGKVAQKMLASMDERDLHNLRARRLELLKDENYEKSLTLGEYALF